MSLFGTYRRKLATVAAFFLIFLFGGCGPTPKCHEVGDRLLYGVFTLGLSEADVDCGTIDIERGRAKKEWERAKQKALEKAKKGDPEAQYLTAINTPEPDERWMWMCRAAMQDHPSAQQIIANWFDSNVEPALWNFPIQRPDNVKALVWYTLAVSNGYQDHLKTRDRVAEALTPDQFAEAERLIAAWKPDPGWCEKTTSPDS